jgi:hypothetical protein
MSNYLRGLGRAVGFTDNTTSRGPHRGQGKNEWDVVSHASSRGGVNLLNRASGLGQGQPRGGGGTGQWGKKPSPAHADWDKGNPREEGTGQLGTPQMMVAQLNGTINNREREGGIYPGQSIGTTL